MRGEDRKEGMGGSQGRQERREGWDSGVARLRGGVAPGPSTEEEGQMAFRKSRLDHLMWNSLTIICL